MVIRGTTNHCDMQLRDTSSGALGQAISEHAADSSPNNQSIAAENTGVPVEIDGGPILVVYTQIAGFSPQERAAAIERRIVDLAKSDYKIPVFEIREVNGSQPVRGKRTSVEEAKHDLYSEMPETECDREQCCLS